MSDKSQPICGRVSLELSKLKRLVKPIGSFWIHATYHNSGIVNVACQILGLEIINEVVWFKRNAFPNLSARRLMAEIDPGYAQGAWQRIQAVLEYL